VNKVQILSPSLSEFVEKYFVKTEFNDMFSVRDDEITKVLSDVESTLVKILENNYKEDDPSLWFNREMCMRALVVLTHIDYFAEIMERNGFLERGLMLYSRILDSFSKKILEDPEIVKAIQEDRLEEEIQKRFVNETSSEKRTSNFLSGAEIEEPKDLLEVPDEYQPIPEKL